MRRFLFAVSAVLAGAILAPAQTPRDRAEVRLLERAPQVRMLAYDQSGPQVTIELSREVLALPASERGRLLRTLALTAGDGAVVDFVVAGHSLAVRGRTDQVRSVDSSTSDEPRATRVTIASDGSESGDGLAQTLNPMLADLGYELTPDRASAGMVMRLEASDAVDGVGILSGESEASRALAAALKDSLDAVSPALGNAGVTVVCEACLADESGGTAPEVGLSLGSAFTEASARMYTALAVTSTLRSVTGTSTVNAATLAAITSPTPGSTLTSANVTFTWSAGSGVSRYYLFIGNWVGGNTLYSADQGTNLSATITGLPTDGRRLYVRLWSLVDGAWQSQDFEFQAFSSSGTGPTPATMTSPAAGSTLSGSTVTFTWNAGTGVTRYWLFVGLWQGGNTLYSNDMDTATSAQVAGLPTTGGTVYVRLWSYINGAWQSSDSTYQASGSSGSPAKATMSSPTPGGALAGTTVTFTWNAGTSVTRYFLMVGLWQGGNTIYSNDMGTSLSAQVSGLPSDGSPVYVRLWSYINSDWQYNDYQYTGYDTNPGPAQKAELVSPAPGSTLSGASATFSWTAGKRVGGYYLFIGDWVGGNTIFSSAYSAGTTSGTVNGLPTDGRLLFIRLWSYIDGQWTYNDYTVRAKS